MRRLWHDVMIAMSSAYAREDCVAEQGCVYPACRAVVGVYPCPPTHSQRRRGSMYKRKMSGDSVSPWMVPRVTWIVAVVSPVVFCRITWVEVSV